MNTQKENQFDILKEIDTPFGGLLRCLYAIKFIDKKELNDEQKQTAFKCLNIIAEDTKNSNNVRAWCYNELGLIHSGRSSFITVS